MTGQRGSESTIALTPAECRASTSLAPCARPTALAPGKLDLDNTLSRCVSLSVLAGSGTLPDEQAPLDTASMMSIIIRFISRPSVTHFQIPAAAV